MDNLKNNSLSPHDVFFPSTPIVSKKQCYGRHSLVKRIRESLQEKGKHVLLFGGRGYGKTSIANMITHDLPNFLTVKINCHRNLNSFTQIWKDIFKKILLIFSEESKKIKLKKKETYFPELKDFLFTYKIEIIDILSFFKKLDFPVLIILDEADLFSKSPQHVSQFADSIKALSDQLPWVKLLIVGIAENSSELIGEHASLERCLTEVKVERMSEQDLLDILDSGLLKIGIQAGFEVRKNIVLFSHGLPYYVHLLSLYALEDALSLSYKILVEKNFYSSVLRALSNMNENLTKTLDSVLGRSKKNYLPILNAALIIEEQAMAEQFYLSRQSNEYHLDLEAIGFTAAQVSERLQKKNLLSLNESKVSRILNLLSHHHPSKTSKKIFIRRKELRKTVYHFDSPLFRAFLRHRLYEATEVSKPVFFVS